ncbi:MAG: autotransporter domain-containing protein [Rhizobiales bacterium]|nr:autotransporter domain-containing protein [Hyphomicrobiales bacterium]
MSFAYTWHRLQGSRTIVFQGFGDQARDKDDAATFQTFGELGYGIDGWASFEPFVSLTSMNFTDGKFNERGGAATLRVDSKAIDTTFNTLGLRGFTVLDFGGRNMMLRGLAGWRHAYGDVTPLSSNAFAGGNIFTVAACRSPGTRLHWRLRSMSTSRARCRSASAITARWPTPASSTA